MEGQRGYFALRLERRARLRGPTLSIRRGKRGAFRVSTGKRPRPAKAKVAVFPARKIEKARCGSFHAPAIKATQLQWLNKNSRALISPQKTSSSTARFSAGSAAAASTLSTPARSASLAGGSAR